MATIPIILFISSQSTCILIELNYFSDFVLIVNTASGTPVKLVCTHQNSSLTFELEAVSCRQLLNLGPKVER